MAKFSVFVTRQIPEPGQRMVEEYCNAEVWRGDLPPPRDLVLREASHRDGILSLLTTPVDKEVMDRAGADLKVISNYAVGFDNIDMVEATRRGIPVGHTPDVLTDTTADFAFALLMATARRVVEGDSYVRARKWQTWGPTLLLGQDIAGSTLGILGFGRIGRGMARRGSGFGMRTLFYDDYIADDSPAIAELGVTKVDLDQLLQESDFISVHTPLTPETHHLLNAQAFAKMKNTAIVINTARGPLIDPAALYTALTTGQILYAGLDVTDPEPIPQDSPLLVLDNIIIAPHIASASVVTRSKMAEMAAQNLIAGLEGRQIPHCANPEVYR